MLVLNVFYFLGTSREGAGDTESGGYPRRRTKRAGRGERYKWNGSSDYPSWNWGKTMFFFKLNYNIVFTESFSLTKLTLTTSKI